MRRSWPGPLPTWREDVIAMAQGEVRECGRDCLVCQDLQLSQWCTGESNARGAAMFFLRASRMARFSEGLVHDPELLALAAAAAHDLDGKHLRAAIEIGRVHDIASRSGRDDVSAYTVLLLQRIGWPWWSIAEGILARRQIAEDAWL